MTKDSKKLRIEFCFRFILGAALYLYPIHRHRPREMGNVDLIISIMMGFGFASLNLVMDGLDWPKYKRSIFRNTAIGSAAGAGIILILIMCQYMYLPGENNPVIDTRAGAPILMFSFFFGLLSFIATGLFYIFREYKAQESVPIS